MPGGRLEGPAHRTLLSRVLPAVVSSARVKPGRVVRRPPPGPPRRRSGRPAPPGAGRSSRWARRGECRGRAGARSSPGSLPAGVSSSGSAAGPWWRPSVRVVDEPRDRHLDGCLAPGLVRIALAQGPRDGDAVLVLLDDPGVDVGLARDRRGVAEVGGDLLDRGLHRSLPRRLGVPLLRALGERDSSEDRRVPGAEVLGGEVLVDHLRDVGVDRGSVEVGPARVPAVGEEPSGAAPAPAHDIERRDDLRVVDRHGVLDPRLPDELEEKLAPPAPHVPPLEGGQPEGAVGVRVRVTADAEVAEVEKPGRGGGGGGEGHPLVPEVLDEPLPGLGQPGACGLDPVELHLVALLAPHRVVEVLAAAGGIGADRLDVPVGVGADPDVLPGRRNREGADSLDLLGRKPATVGVVVGEPPAGPPPGPPLHLRRDPPQPRHAWTLGQWAAVTCGYAAQTYTSVRRRTRGAREVAAEVITPRFRSLATGEVMEKNPGDLVTVADREAEAIITARLGAAYPDAVVLGQEAHPPE